MNDQRFQYQSRGGSVFTCPVADLRQPIRVSSQAGDDRVFASDVAEMAAFHAQNVWPKLNGFSGYDTLTFEFR